MILAGDIGGTKTVLALYDPDASAQNPQTVKTFFNRRYSGFDALLDAFTAEKTEISAAVFGVAGPVQNGSCRTTNLPWSLDVSGLEKRFGTSRVRLLNDLEAAAYGMLSLDDSVFVELNPAAVPRRENRAVIAAGTGLGEALLFFDGKEFHPVATEGGHCDFAPLTPRQEQLLRWLRARFSDHVSYERILSGPGIPLLYRFLAESGFAPETVEIDATEDPAARITRAALQTRDPLSRETLRLFAEIYGAEAGNLALKSLARGGIYLGGGIAPKILPALQSGSFLDAFRNKGRFGPMMEKISVRVCTEEKAALFGAAAVAAGLVRSGSTSVR